MSALVVSIHDVSPLTLATVQRQRDALAAWGIGRVTLLAVPDHHGRAPLVASRETVAWLRARLAAGDEVCLHGHYHVQRHAPAGRDGLRAKVFTAGEGECLTLDDEGRRVMLHDERARLEDALGARLAGFVAPAWLEPEGFGEALRAAGFAWHETGLWVERLGVTPREDRRLRAPVIGWATRSLPRIAAALAWAAALRRPLALAARVGAAPARVALHPGDDSSPAVRRSIEATVRGLRRSLTPMTTAAAIARA